MKKSCKTCCYLDEIFGDCCHPKGGGVNNVEPSLKNCGEANKYAWWKPLRKEQILNDRQD